MKKKQEAARQLAETSAAKRPVQSKTPTLPPVPAISSIPKWKIIVLCLMVFVVAFAVYANTIGGDFIWDDEYLIINNSQIKSFNHLPNVFKTWVGYGSENINNFYRPVQEISNMVDYFLWGLKPAGFHFTNVVLHALVSAMVCLFLLYLSGSLVVAGVASLLYAVHPVHTEAIAYIAGRADPLYAFFMLVSLILFISAAQAPRASCSRVKFFLSLVCFALSILSKEIVVVMPLLVFLYVLYFKREGESIGPVKALKWAWVPYFAIFAVYAYLRLTVLSFADVAPASVFGKIPLVLRLVTFFRTLLVYFGLLLVPNGLHMERAIPISTTVFDFEEIAGIAVVVALIWSACWTFRRNRLVSFGIVWFFANLLPVSNIVPINSFLAEHWLYMASVGMFLLVGLGAAYVYDKLVKGNIALKIGFMLAIAGMVSYYAVGTIVRNRDWKDEISFFTSTLKYHPKNARLYLNLGNTYYEKGDVAKAIEQYQKSIDINKDYAVAYGNIGSAFLHEGKAKEAEKYLTKAVGLQQNYPIAHYNLGIISFQKGDYEGAVKELKLSTEQLPQFFQAWNMLGRTYLKLGNGGEAKGAFERSLSIMPSQPDIQMILQKIGETRP